jgi:hypothetical protein
MNKITEHTLIPLSLVISFIGAIVYVTFAMAKVDTIIANDMKQDSKIEGQTTLLLDIRDRIIRLEERKK